MGGTASKLPKDLLSEYQVRQTYAIYLFMNINVFFIERSCFYLFIFSPFCVTQELTFLTKQEILL